MAISKAEKAAYNDEIKDIKKELEENKTLVRDITLKKKKMPGIGSYFNIEIAARQMDIVGLYFKMNDLSLEMLGIKNSNFLDNARKEFYKLLQEMEEVVGSEIDRTLRENDEYLARIDRFNPAQIIGFVKKIHSVFDTLVKRVGEESKWKWSFVELQSRVAVITKNITNFSDVAKYRDPRVEFFYERRDLMQLCKDSLTEAAKQYRTKYELSGHARDDLKKSIDLLSSLRKIHVLFGEDVEATRLKNTIDAARQALDAEDKSSEKKKKIAK